MHISSFSIRLFLLSLVLLASCGRDVPEGILSPDEMQVILEEIHLSDAAVQKTSNPGWLKDQMRHEIYDEVFERHDMDKYEFDRSYQYYLDHPVELDSIYVRVIENLNKRIPEVQQNYRPNKNKPTATDSPPQKPKTKKKAAVLRTE